MTRRIKAGFTILELMVYSTILLILVGSITLAVQAGMKYMRQGTEYQEAQRQTLIGLGLNKMHRTRELEDTPAVRGMIAKIPHMVKIIEERG